MKCVPSRGVGEGNMKSIGAERRGGEEGWGGGVDGEAGGGQSWIHVKEFGLYFGIKCFEQECAYLRVCM